VLRVKEKLKIKKSCCDKQSWPTALFLLLGKPIVTTRYVLRLACDAVFASQLRI
jgi:hypothetical protein